MRMEGTFQTGGAELETSKNARNKARTQKTEIKVGVGRRGHFKKKTKVPQRQQHREGS